MRQRSRKFRNVKRGGRTRRVGTLAGAASLAAVCNAKAVPVSLPVFEVIPWGGFAFYDLDGDDLYDLWLTSLSGDWELHAQSYEIAVTCSHRVVVDFSANLYLQAYEAGEVIPGNYGLGGRSAALEPDGPFYEDVMPPRFAGLTFSPGAVGDNCPGHWAWVQIRVLPGTPGMQDLEVLAIGYEDQQLTPVVAGAGGAVAAEREQAVVSLIPLQNEPNPFYDTTTIRFGLARSSRAVIRIFDVAGSLVRVLDVGMARAGANTVSWDRRDAAGKRVSSGVYLYRLEAPDVVRSSKMVVLD